VVAYKSILLSLFFLIIGSFSIENRANFAYDRRENTTRFRIVSCAGLEQHNYSDPEQYSHSKSCDANNSFRKFNDSSESSNFGQATLYATKHGHLSVRAKEEYNRSDNQRFEVEAPRQYDHSHDFDNQQHTMAHEAYWNDPQVKENFARRNRTELLRRNKIKQHLRYNQEIKKRLESNNGYLKSYTTHCRDQIIDNTINSSHKDRLQARADAIAQSQSNSFAATRKKYILSDQAQQLIEECNAKTDTFSRLHGSLIQQQLHQEVVDIVSKAATIHFYPNQNQSKQMLTTTIGKLAEVAIEHNELGHITQTITLTDCCVVLLDCALGIGDGAIDGVLNTANTFAHPLDSLVGVAYVTANAAFCLGKVLHHVCDVSITLCYDKDAGLDKLNQDLSTINNTIKAIYRQSKKMSAREISRTITATVVEVALTKKCLGVIGTLYKEAQTGFITVAHNIKNGMEPQLAIAGMPLHASVAAQGAEYAALLAESGGEIKAKNKLLAEISKKVSKKLDNQTFVENTLLNKSMDNVKWTSHGFKHFSSKKLSWNEIIKTTKNGIAKYKPNIDVESIERLAWEKGIICPQKNNWKVLKFDYPVGAKNGLETYFIRVEMSAQTIHGHPITLADFNKLTKPI